MSVPNKEQIRACSALKFWNAMEDGGNAVDGLPALIVNNGLLATLSFAFDKGNEHARLMANVAAFLVDQGGGNVFSASVQGKDDSERVRSFAECLSRQDSSTLRRATVEALSYIGYLKRFAPPKSDKRDGVEEPPNG